MAQTLEVMRRRIESARDLHGIVRVMKALASSGIRQCEKAVESMRDYNQAIELGLQALLRNQPEGFGDCEVCGTGRPAILLFGTDQGMCGAFNERVTGFLMKSVDDPAVSTVRPDVVSVGARILGRLEDGGFRVRGHFSMPSTLSAIPTGVNQLLLHLEEMRFRQGVDRVDLIHQRPGEEAGIHPVRVRLWPLDPGWLEGLRRKPWKSRSLPTLGGDWKLLFSRLVREHLFSVLYRAFAESMASENAARLASMQAAEKNIEGHLASLTGQYHQSRQQEITEELMDIVTGFENSDIELD